MQLVKMEGSIIKEGEVDNEGNQQVYIELSRQFQHRSWLVNIKRMVIVVIRSEG